MAATKIWMAIFKWVGKYGKSACGVNPYLQIRKLSILKKIEEMVLRGLCMRELIDKDFASNAYEVYGEL